MALSIPDHGLSLWRGDQPGAASPDPHSKPTQIMRINLAQNTVDELVESLRKDQKARLRLGKHQTLYYGSKSQPFHTSLEHHRSELYRVNNSDRENWYFSGLLSHSLEVQKAKEATAATDEALANLEQSLSAFERGKESKKTQLVNLKPEGRRSNAKALPSKADLEKERFFNNRSLPNSPSLGGIRSPASLPALTPTSAPPSQNKRKIRLDALKVPFMHLLAVSPVSLKYIAQTTRASPDDCLELANKYAVENRIDPSKYNLKDRYYKELDIWNFPYPSEADRTSAIESAISAFDRQRISPSDKLWQKLNSKEEKAKGICKSRLKLQTGPPPPQIKVHASEKTAKESEKDDTMPGNETDHTNGRLTPIAAAGAASTKGSQLKKKAAPARSKNTTLTGRITKRTDKKAPAKADGKFKSAEFVHDSDEDLDMTDTPAPPAAPPPKKKPAETSKPASKLKVDTKAAPAKAAAAAAAAAAPARSPAIKSQVTMEPRPRSLKTVPANSNGTSSKTLPGSRQTKPTSPTKPSPLASSPPTNASDFDNSTQNSGQTSSSSSSPLMAQVSRQQKAKPPPTTTAKPKEAARPNGAVKPLPNPLKRKTLAEPTPSGRLNGDDLKRRRPLHSPSGTSSGSASPPLNRETLRQQLRQKTAEFKELYAKYYALHKSLEQTDQNPSDLMRLERMRSRVLRMKEAIWNAYRRLEERHS